MPEQHWGCSNFSCSISTHYSCSWFLLISNQPKESVVWGFFFYKMCACGVCVRKLNVEDSKLIGDDTSSSKKPRWVQSDETPTCRARESDFKPPVGRSGARLRLCLGGTRLSKHQELARQNQVQLRDVLNISVRANCRSFRSSRRLEPPVFINGRRRQRRLPLIAHVSWNHRPFYDNDISFCQERDFYGKKLHISSYLFLSRSQSITVGL